MKDEALKLALEALEVYWVKAEHRRSKEDEYKARDAITAIKQALAAPVQEPVYIKTFHGGKPWPLHPEPVQEPVAWRVKVETKLRDGSVDVGYQVRNEKMSAYDEPLYTTPPAAQRQWVGLTADDIKEIWNGEPMLLPWDMTRILAIQQASKEKNT